MESDFKKKFMDTFEDLAAVHRATTVWADFIVMSACAISNVVDKQHFDERERMYRETVKKYTAEEWEQFPTLLACLVNIIEENPEQDFLGEMYMQWGLYSDRHKQILTPYHIAEMMTNMTFGDNLVEQIAVKNYITVSDPTCGSGVMLIATLNEARKQLSKANLNFQNHILVSGQDIEPTAALMCYIQISLLGGAGYVKVGDTLAHPIDKTDSTENYWFTPMYFSDAWKFRRLINGED